jgi:hypothetical protein
LLWRSSPRGFFLQSSCRAVNYFGFQVPYHNMHHNVVLYIGRRIDAFSLYLRITSEIEIAFVEFKRFWRWCIAHRITGFLDFFRRLGFLGVETRRFGNWIRFRPHGKGGENTYSVGPPEDGNRSSFRNAVFLLPRTRATEKKSKIAFI